MIDTPSNAIINVYSPEEPCSEAYIVANLDGLKELYCKLGKLLYDINSTENSSNKLVSANSSINISDSNDENYNLVIVYDEELKQKTDAPYTEQTFLFHWIIEDNWKI